MAGRQERSSGGGVVVSVNLARMRKVPMGDLLYETGIWKLPVDRRVRAEELGLAGDVQGDPKVHGGPMKAVYAYAEEDNRWWEEQLRRRIVPGSFGENHRFSEANRPGAYLSVVEAGDLGTGDTVEVIDRPAHPVTIGLLAYLMYTDHRLASLLVEMFEQDLTSAKWRDFLREKLAS